MQVSVTLWGNLRRFAPKGAGSMVLQVADDATVEELAVEWAHSTTCTPPRSTARSSPLSARLSPGDRVFCSTTCMAGRACCRFDQIGGGDEPPY